ncbi:MAG TPA: hypothetical protein VNK52_12320 [Hyphomicrobiaceae bacterium]|nr:hypothetical protein [Hyphomicrobiaceae bacterium]
MKQTPKADAARFSAGDRLRELRERARAAQRAGRISHAAMLYVAIAEAEPADGEALHEAGSFLLAVDRSLAGVEALTEQHRRRFALSAAEMEVADLAPASGRRGRHLAQRCLLEACLREPERWQWQLELAEALEKSGRPHQALEWRRNAARLRPDLGEATQQPRPECVPQPAESAHSNLAHARACWRRGDRIAALKAYLAAVEPYKVTAIPQRYEVCGDYKVLQHVDGRFYAIPRRVIEFTIIDGTVYRLTGMARTSGRALPPWVIAAGLRLRAAARMAIAAVPILHPAARSAVVWVSAVVEVPLVRSLLGLLRLAAWQCYRVRGVHVSDRLDGLLDLIGVPLAGRSSVPSEAVGDGESATAPV